MPSTEYLSVWRSFQLFFLLIFVTTFEAGYLNLEEGDPVAVAEQIGYLDTGAAFEYSISVHRYDEFSIDVVLTRDWWRK
mgnify:FL=1